MKWPDKNEIDGETEELIAIVDYGWVWAWPGWRWVSKRLNDEYKNNRTPTSCRKKYNRLLTPQRGR